MNDEAKFWSRVERGEPEQCWPWVGYISQGYGKLRMGGPMVRAHRVAYELLVGPIPEGRELDHLCGNKACCNPAHLQPVPHWVNIARATGNGQRALAEILHPSPVGG